MYFPSFLIAAVSALATVREPVVFRGHPLAESTLSLTGTTLYISPQGSQQSGAQFPYDKKSSVSTDFGLATVYLSNSKGHVATLQTGFDTISQTCSCYWLDVKELVGRFPSLTTGSDYFIAMEGNGYNVQSGTFSLETGRARPPTSPTCRPRSN